MYESNPCHRNDQYKSTPAGQVWSGSLVFLSSWLLHVRILVAWLGSKEPDNCPRCLSDLGRVADFDMILNIPIRNLDKLRVPDVCRSSAESGH